MGVAVAAVVASPWMMMSMMLVAVAVAVRMLMMKTTLKTALMLTLLLTLLHLALMPLMLSSLLLLLQLLLPLLLTPGSSADSFATPTLLSGFYTFLVCQRMISTLTSKKVTIAKVPAAFRSEICYALPLT